ncbi:hypothetical protein B0H14DRAFT_2568502 [Mycena olivaceomarginata]|nr:hypothetical protein B0H14DRAFT_2568502 [Mycena olivaceomarginata]
MDAEERNSAPAALIVLLCFLIAARNLKRTLRTPDTDIFRAPAICDGLSVDNCLSLASRTQLSTYPLRNESPGTERGMPIDLAVDVMKKRRRCYNCGGIGHLSADCPSDRDVAGLGHVPVDEDGDYSDDDDYYDDYAFGLPRDADIGSWMKYGSPKSRGRCDTPAYEATTLQGEFATAAQLRGSVEILGVPTGLLENVPEAAYSLLTHLG